MNLDLADPIRQLGLICGLAYIPHSLAKFTARDSVFGFFQAAGFRPVALFVYTSLLVEITVTVCMTFGIFMTFAGWISAIFMLTAAASVLKVSGGEWSWNLGGCEYHVFWALCSLVVALHATT
ncbi:DoxX family protein [Rhodopseudomonas sp. P2A-2r]|uniref:DoxX family protein n=1 Tax=unclassified Rhodopseudomonas TaxID=2638247 RepID=UPI0022348C8A|nr:DoxX family protein [Rhodopseudomonas sp. P2A-2r]UZE50680.1 DoxX family protein [Rhodopseudomonas sp. P2A-2r]